jgi:hypothetical protein
MTTPDRPGLAEALGIPGAHAVSLLDPEGPTVLWWAGAAPPDEQQTAAVVTLAAAAAGMVLSAPGDELGDVLLTSTEAFHVVRLVEDTRPCVAHLTLRRAGANLAMARREFRTLVESYTRELPAPALPSGPAPALLPGPAHSLSPGPAPSLPRRSQSEPSAAPTPPDWLDLLGIPYLDDDEVLDRVLVGLHHL